MKLVALLLLFAIVGKMSAAPVPLRLAYYRAVPVNQQPQSQELEADEEEEADDDETDISTENENDFSNSAISQQIQDDDDDSEEHEEPPPFNKLFPMPQRTSPGYNFPMAVMMGEISEQGWKVPKVPKEIKDRQQQRARNEIELARDDEDEESDEDEEDEEEDEEDDVPDWDTLFPSEQQLSADPPPSSVVDTSAQPEVGGFRSGIPGSRVVYVPAGQLRARPMPSQGLVSRQYIMRNAVPPRSQAMYGYMPSNVRRQHVVMQSRPQYVLSSSMQRRPQQGVYYLPVRRNSYSPYVSPYAPRYIRY